jgi:hypothetical protein
MSREAKSLGGSDSTIRFSRSNNLLPSETFEPCNTFQREREFIDCAIVIDCAIGRLNFTMTDLHTHTHT